jgi:hypothetical protein
MSSLWSFYSISFADMSRFSSEDDWWSLVVDTCWAGQSNDDLNLAHWVLFCNLRFVSLRFASLRFSYFLGLIFLIFSFCFFNLFEKFCFYLSFNFFFILLSVY